MANYEIKIIGIDRAERNLSKIQANLPKALEKDCAAIADDMKFGLKTSALEHDLLWTGILVDSIRKQKYGNGFAVTMKQYGEYLDTGIYAKPVPINVIPLHQWYKEHEPLEPGMTGYHGKGKIRITPRRGWRKKGIDIGRKNIQDRLGKGNVVRVVGRGVL